MANAGSRVRTGIHFVAIVNIAVAYRLPQVAQRKRPVSLKLLYVSKLVQEQFERRGNIGGQPNGSP